MNLQSLEHKVAIVTGAGRGIGRAIALACAEAGAAVGCAARSLSEIADTVGTIGERGGKAIAVQTDVTDPAAVQHLIDTVAGSFGGLDILVINAGISPGRHPVENSDAEHWQEVLNVNLFGAYHCARAAIPYLKQRGAGKIITVGSGMGHRGKPGSSAYSCSKAGLWMLTRVLAQELWDYNISVNELVPGPVDTRMNTAPDGLSSFGDSEWIKGPEEVTQLALFLAAQPDRGPSAQSFSLMRRDG
ncbi:MAG: SDR family NAD(P)-dependent oxidoreductase [Methylococcus sp.]|nr:SDR family NAD(P)-dependent oxidoreductase [Methylococcus sp.]